MMKSLQSAAAAATAYRYVGYVQGWKKEEARTKAASITVMCYFVSIERALTYQLTAV